MKGVSKKKVFKIIGIVLGSVFGFVGVVVGVLALMGKFKTPVVFPTELVFLDNDVIVVEGKTYDTEKTWEEQFVGLEEGEEAPEIKYFILEGVNPGAEHEVNKKDCYLWFNENIGVDLITLCDENGKPLVKDERNRYLVECNEPIYYMINKVADDYETDGNVQFLAKSVNEKVMVNNPLSFWIDRVTQGAAILTDLDKPITWDKINTQEITVGVGIDFEIKYEVKTELSLKPIAKESAKVIELYFDATGYDYGTDYVKVTEEEINNTSSPLNSILYYDNGVLKFKAEKKGDYKFVIAMFPTYAQRIEYEQSIAGLEINNPNFHRVEAMKQTVLTVEVQSIDVSEVGLMGSAVLFNLYSQKDYITLNGTSGVTSAKDNNLELYMKKGTGVNTVLDYSRFDEVSMEGFEDCWVDRTPIFEANDGTKWSYDKTSNSIVLESDATIKKSITSANVIGDLHIGAKLQVVSYLQFIEDGTERTFKCVNGAAVWDTTETTNVMRVLQSGSYLNFYTQDVNGKFNYLDLKFDANVVEGKSGQEKSWQIITKQIPDLTNGTTDTTDDDLQLRLAILVVNNDGKFEIDNFFASIPVSINEVVLDYSILNNNLDLDITFTEEDTIYSFEEWQNIVQINNSGTYKEYVLVTNWLESNNYMINTIPEVVFGDGNNKYVLVGDCVRDNDGDVTSWEIGKVRVNNKVNVNNKNCKIYMLQLEHAYDETANYIVEEILSVDDSETRLEVANEYVKELYINDYININSKYIINTDAEFLSFEYYDVYKEEGKENKLTGKLEDLYAVYEDTPNHTIVISSKNEDMLIALYNFYGVSKDRILNFFDVNYSDALTITNVYLEKDGENFTGKLVVKYEAEGCLSDDRIPIIITLKGVGGSFSLPSLLILSGSPDQIVLNTGDLKDSNNTSVEPKSINLSKSETSVAETIVVEVSYKDGKYEYILKYNNNTIVSGLSIFNKNISGVDALGFQGAEDKDQNFEVGYTTVDKDVFNVENLFTEDGNLKGENLVSKVGSTILTVTIGETSQYINIETKANGFGLTTANNTTSFDTHLTDPFKLDDAKFGKDNSSPMVSLKYNETSILLSKNNLVYIDNIKIISYGDGNLVAFGSKTDGWELKKNADDTSPVLTIKDNSKITLVGNLQKVINIFL